MRLAEEHVIHSLLRAITQGTHWDIQIITKAHNGSFGTLIGRESIVTITQARMPKFIKSNKSSVVTVLNWQTKNKYSQNVHHTRTRPNGNI